MTGSSSDGAASSEANARWSPLTRVAFRLCFCYFLLYALCCGNATLWEAIPYFGLRVEGWWAKPFQHGAQWLAQPLFYLQGVGARLHASGFNDRALDWIAAGLMLAVAVVAAAIWSAADRRRTEYRTLFTWMRFALRLALIAGMFVYADMKIFPVQIGPPSLAVLNEKVGNASPMTMLWTVLGMSPTYEVLCGVIEFCGGVLLLFRRTALAGALLSGVILSNIVLFDYFFDVPVKLYSTNLLLMTVIVVAPDMRALVRFFWSHRPAVAASAWAPWFRRVSLRRATVAVEIVFAVMFCLVLPYRRHAMYAQMEANLRHPSPLAGQWHVDAAVLDGQPRAFLTGDGKPMTDLFLEPSGRITMRGADGRLWTGGRTDYAHRMLLIMSPVRLFLVYEIREADDSHLVLAPAQGGSWPMLRLTRVPLPAQYPLFERGFHFINEWGFER